jgi:hypothetical protein
MARTLSLAALALSAVTVACGGGGSSSAQKTAAPATSAAATDVPGAAGRATLLGALTLDGEPLEADFLGAVVIHDGLMNACQQALVAVRGGGYEIDVMADAEARGCGAPGGRIVLWANAGHGNIYSREGLAWPGAGQTTFNASFSTSAPDGASIPATEFYGHVSRADGTRLGAGTVVEAYVEGTLCGVATVRDYSGDVAFVLSVAGHAPGCAKDATITFRADGAQATETATNDLGRGSAGHDLELTLN